MPEPTKTPVRGYEIKRLLMLSGMASEMMRTLELPALQRRLDGVGKRRRMQSIVTEVQGILEAVYKTVPIDKLRTLQANLEHLGIQVIQLTPQATTHLKDRTVILTDTLDAILMAACRNECALCDGTKAEMQRCRFRQALREVIIDDEEDLTGICVGQTLLARRDEE